MQFTSKTDIEAPLAVVFASLTDFEAWERAALRRGADVSRTDTMRIPGPGITWATRFAFRGKDREIELKLVTMEPAGKLAFSAGGKMLEGEMGLDLVELSPKRTRLVMNVDVRPMTLGARLMLQTLKLGRAKVQTKLNQRMMAMAKDIEARHAASSPRSPR